MRDEEQYLSDIVEAAGLISEQAAKITYDEFLINKTFQNSILFGFTIIGEAANKISRNTKENYPEIEWSTIVSFRNIIVHAYFSLNLKTVWDAAINRALPLAEQVRSIIKREFENELSDT